jgi:hypothetical protein
MGGQSPRRDSWLKMLEVNKASSSPDHEGVSDAARELVDPSSLGRRYTHPD